MDLEGSPEFQGLDVALVSIAIDTTEELVLAAKPWGALRTPLLSDIEGTVTGRYGGSVWSLHGGEPGHIFVLVGQDGRVKWVKDYGAPENGGLMYIPAQVLNEEILQRLPAPEIPP